MHSLSPCKRVHLTLSFERLAELQRRAGLDEFQRVGLSATQKPIEEIAKFLGGLSAFRAGRVFRPVRIVEEPSTRELDVVVRTWTTDMGQIGQIVLDGDRPKMSGAAAGDPYVRYSIWDDIHRQVATEIREHATTLVFVNSRRQYERLAAMLNEELGEDVVRAHHGSLSKGKRSEIESLLKAGSLKAIVATSSLELGIDMGSIDLVIQVEAPQSVSSGLQRIGRANHRVGEIPAGVLVPKHRHDLIVCTVSANAMLASRIESTVVPRNPLDVLAQQIVAMAVSSEEPVEWSRLLEVVRSCYSFMDISEAALRSLLEMLSGTGQLAGVSEVGPRICLDPTSFEFTARKGARLAVVMNPGVIPDRGLYRVVTPDGSLVGELDEEMVFETRPGEAFVLGASSWKVSQITKDRVIVELAPGQLGKTPFGKGEGLGRSYEFGKELADFFRSAEGGMSSDSLEYFPLDQNSKKILFRTSMINFHRT